MNTAVETLSPTRVRITVEIPFDELKPSMDEAYRRIARAINVPGFRKGKVPAAIIDQRVGREAVLDEAVNDLIPQAYNDAVRSSDLKVLGQPDVDVSSFEDGQPLVFTAEVDVRPEITLPEYKGIKVEVDDAEASEADVDEQLDRLRDRFASLTPVDRAVATGDFVVLDLTASLDGAEIDDASASGLSYEVGSGELVDGLDEALVGAAKDDTVSVTTRLTNGEHADKDAEVQATVKSVRERNLPDLDDDFAQLASEFDTFDELREQVATQAAEIRRIEQAVQARDRVVEALLALVDVPVPDNLVKQEADAHLEPEGRLDDAEHRAEIEGDLRESLRRQFVLDAIAKAENLTVSEGELTDYLIAQSSRYGMAPGQFAEEVAKAGQVPAFVGEVVRGKALALVLESAEITDASGRPVDLEELNRTEVADA